MIKLKSGRVIQEHAEIIGLYSSGVIDAIYTGYDDRIDIYSEKDKEELLTWRDEDELSKLIWTHEERKELAELMIARWKEFGGIE